MTDQVPRLQRYWEEHPDITIEPPGRQSALWKALDGEKILAKNFWLERLLDTLERIT